MGTIIHGVMFGRRLAQTILLASLAAGFEFPGFGCHLVVEKNEWAAGCVPAVNFVVKLSNCDDGTAMSDVTILFLDESNHELGRDYFAAPTGQCSVSGYGNVRTITPRVRVVLISAVLFSNLLPRYTICRVEIMSSWLQAPTYAASKLQAFRAIKFQSMAK